MEALECPRLFIGNIYDTIRERDIIEVFRKYNIESVRIIYDRDGALLLSLGLSLGPLYVMFTSARHEAKVVLTPNVDSKITAFK